MIMFEIPWDKAPKWAKYAAMDASGRCYWYREKPAFNVTGGYWYGVAFRPIEQVSYEEAKNSLVERP